MRKVKLEDISEKIDYGLTEKAQDQNVGPKFLRITDIQNNKVNWQTVPYCVCSDKDFEKNKLESGDIVFARTGATTGKSFLIKNLVEPTIYASYLIRLRINQELAVSGYIAYFFKSDTYWQQIYLDSDGATLPSFNATKLKNLKIPLPSLDEQKAIVAKLDRAQRLIDIDRAMLAKYDELIQSVFLEMFGDPVTNPKGFEKGTIRDLVSETRYGTNKKAHESKGEYPVIRMGNLLYNGEWDFSDRKYVDLEEKELEKYLVYKGDILFNRTNSKELVGKTGVYREENPIAYAGYLIRVRPNEKAISEYISGYLNSPYGKLKLEHMCKNIVGMANINAQELQDIPILIPPKEIQMKYREKVETIRKQREVIAIEQNRSQELFSSLLRQAFG